MADVDLPFANGGIRRIGAATTDETIFIIGGRQPDGAINQAIHTGVVYVAPLNSESWETYE